MTLKKQKNKQHKDVLTDPLYRPKVVITKKEKEKRKKVPKNKLFEEAKELDFPPREDIGEPDNDEEKL